MSLKRTRDVLVEEGWSWRLIEIDDIYLEHSPIPGHWEYTQFYVKQKYKDFHVLEAVWTDQDPIGQVVCHLAFIGANMILQGHADVVFVWN